jgi:hypothetical protein
MGLRARIQNGLLVAKAPPGYDEGEEVEVELVDSLEENLSEAEIERINQSLSIARAQFAAGDYGTEEQLRALLDDRK